MSANCALSPLITCGEATDLLTRLPGLPVVIDTETDGLLVRDGQHEAKYLGITLTSHPDRCFVVKGPFTRELKVALGKSMLVGHNIRFDIHALGLLPFLNGAAPYDTMVRHYAHSTTSLKSLDDMAVYMGCSKIKTPALIKQGRIAEVPEAEVAAYLGDDCCVTAALFLRQLKAQGAAKPVNVLDFDVERAVARMEQRGVRLLTEPLAALGLAVNDEITRTKLELQSQGCDSSFNVGSPKQVLAAFKQRGITPPRNKDTGRPSTGKIALETLERRGDLLAPAIMAARKALKLRDAFLTPLPTFVSPLTGLIHASTKTAHTRTGRVSYEGPNLQQIPKHGHLGQQFRGCFTSRSGRVAGADFGQVEMRVAAAFSQDQRLLAIFDAGEDLHTSVAAQVRGKALAAVTKEERFKAKAVNFGILNGMGARRLAHEIKTTVDEAQAFLDDYLKTFSGLHEWMERVWRDCEAWGVAKTLAGHQRVFTDDEETRPGISVVVQGSAADLMRAALVAVEDAGLCPILAVHDEIVTDAEEADLTSGEELAKIMEMAANDLWRTHTGSLPVSFKASHGYGDTWGAV